MSQLNFAPDNSDHKEHYEDAQVVDETFEEYKNHYYGNRKHYEDAQVVHEAFDEFQNRGKYINEDASLKTQIRELKAKVKRLGRDNNQLWKQ